MVSKFKTGVLGGTFDHFHKGHEKLIEHGLFVCEKLVIGITSDKYIKKLKTNNEELRKFENFEIRKKSIEDFLNNIVPSRFEIVRINDLFGPTLDKNFNVDAIVVSKETKNGALKINEERAKVRLSQLNIEVFPEVLAEDSKPISSMRIRDGEIDREGKLFIKPQWLGKDLLITEEIRGKLKKPWGSILKNLGDYDFKDLNDSIISVGDETAKTLNSLLLRPKISVIDFKVARKKVFSDIKELGFPDETLIIKVLNPSGTITSDLLRTAREVIKEKREGQTVLLIDGEDDLAVIPFILVSPLGSCIFYGQPGEGLVKIIVTEKIKARIREIVAGFNTRGY